MMMDELLDLDNPNLTHFTTQRRSFPFLSCTMVIARAWGYDGRERTWVFWLLIGSINIGAFIHLAPYIAYWLLFSKGLFYSYLDHVSQNLHPLLSLTGTFLKIPVFYKSWSFLIKFYSFGAMTHGIFFFYFFAWSLSCLFTEKESSANWCIYAIALLGLLLFYPVFVPFAILFTLLYAAFLFQNQRDRTGPLFIKCTFISAAIGGLCLPYFLILGTKTGATDIPVFSLSFNPEYLWVYMAGPFWPLLPLVLYWAFKIRSEEQNVKKVAFLSAGLIASIVSPVFIFISGGPANYKYVYLAALFITWASFSVLMNKNRRPEKRWKWIPALYKGLAIGPVLITVLGWSLGPWFKDDGLSVVGQDVKVKTQREGLETLEWISKRTQKDAVLLIPLTEKDSKASTTYSLAALTGKSLYIANDKTWAGGYETYSERKALAEYIWGSAEAAPDTIQSHPLPGGRPLYLIYSEDVELTTAFYNYLTDPIKALAFFPNGKMKERVEGLGFKTRRVFEKDRFKILEITQ